MEDKKIPLGKLVQIKNVFSPHYKEKISAKLAFKIFRFCTAAEKEEAFYNEKIKEIIDEYGEKGADGKVISSENGAIKIIPGKESECNKAIDEISNTEADLPDISFSEEELSELSISVLDAAVLSDVVTG